ncbi:unnamed protein product [Vitrella brassicaformis CCMP3155]|uniref:Uncharacterized protein n=1 Tax=Vitrella brassicaformis (strain CCMP3155) TaxID=1169540 RepID=A0A0G4FZ69_VITBC|nr:unnamed protein product [Vitrella brassicaformis CCMP3155]|eukprot:CEM20909.1 unnamed protein product [Vitrella brassicaformis CCMP3155]
MSVVFSEGASPSLVTMDADVLLSLSQDHRHTQQHLIEELTKQRDELRAELDDYERRLDDAEQRDRDAEAQITDLEAQLAEEKASVTLHMQQRDDSDYRLEKAEARIEELEAQLAQRKQTDLGPLVPQTIVWMGGLYHGQVLFGKPDGLGVLRTLDGDKKIYEGGWSNGRLFGRGRVDYRLTMPDRSTYKGDTFDGLPHGHGVCYHFSAPDKVEYIGGWANGERHGQGSAYSPVGGWEVFRGEFVWGMAYKGVFLSDGIQYPWRAGQRIPTGGKREMWGGVPSWLPNV